MGSYDCESCGSERTVSLGAGLSRCLECGDVFEDAYAEETSMMAVPRKQRRQAYDDEKYERG